MNKSVWTDTASMPQFEQLKEDISTDVLIIGGGICGILCAYFLSKAGVDYRLVEGKTVCSGNTENTTAKITAQHGLIYSKLIKSIGTENASLYLKANLNAIERYKILCRDINCDYETLPSYTYSLKSRQKIEDEVEAVNKLGTHAIFKDKIEVPIKIAGAIKFFSQAQFNPAKFIAEISKNLKIYENTFVYDISNNIATTKNGKIKAKKIVITTHFPFIKWRGLYFMKLYQHRSYVIALENAQNVHGMYVDEADKGMSFRKYKNYLLIGGGGHRTGKKGGSFQELNKFAAVQYPQAYKKYEWAAQDCMSLDSIPYIGNYSKHTPNIYVATGFNKWGITSSMAAAEILCDLILEKSNEYAHIFSPDRSILKPQLFINGFETVTNLITPTARRCPHMGCALKWNKAEHTWDCPCHGSRFENSGRLIENPALNDIKQDI